MQHPRRRALLALLPPLPPAAPAPPRSLRERRPWRTISDGADARLMLEGHDAVAYFTQNAAVNGSPAIKLEHQGVTWRFASEASSAEFQRNPERYLPQFGGLCSNGINYAVPWGGGGGPNTWRIYRGKLYVFGGQTARDHFEIDTESTSRVRTATGTTKSRARTRCSRARSAWCFACRTTRPTPNCRANGRPAHGRQTAGDAG